MILQQSHKFHGKRLKSMLDIHTAIPLCLLAKVHSVTSYICWRDAQYDSTLCMGEIQQCQLSSEVCGS